MRVVELRDDHLMSDPDVTALQGERLFRPHYDRVIRDTTTVLKPDGTPLLIYVRDAVPMDVCRAVYRRFEHLRLGKTDSRGYAAGGSSFRHQRADGTMSRTVRRRPMNSAVVGYLDRNARNPYCRMTTLARDHGALRHVRPLAEAANDALRQFAPERWDAQRRYVEQVNRDFVIKRTVFTSVTVNRNERTAAHMDANDYRPGLGVMAVLEGGRYAGGELIFPKYRTAVDMRTGGVCLADVHEWHGNARFVGKDFQRLSFIFYARERMHLCGTAEDERDHLARSLGPQAL